jgi:hypothetical protein
MMITHLPPCGGSRGTCQRSPVSGQGADPPMGTGEGDGGASPSPANWGRPGTDPARGERPRFWPGDSELLRTLIQSWRTPSRPLALAGSHWHEPHRRVDSEVRAPFKVQVGGSRKVGAPGRLPGWGERGRSLRGPEVRVEDRDSDIMPDTSRPLTGSEHDALAFPGPGATGWDQKLNDEETKPSLRCQRHGALCRRTLAAGHVDNKTTACWRRHHHESFESALTNLNSGEVEQAEPEPASLSAQ